MMKKTMTKTRKTALIFAFALVVAFFDFGCESPSPKANSNAQKTLADNNSAPDFEQELQTMRNANFDFVYVFRRKDGNVFDSEDKKYLKANSPVTTNRFILTEENKAVIAGSSYKFETENMEKLQERFVIENFSKPTVEDSKPENQNSATNANKQ